MGYKGWHLWYNKSEKRIYMFRLDLDNDDRGVDWWEAYSGSKRYVLSEDSQRNWIMVF